MKKTNGIALCFFSIIMSMSLIACDDGGDETSPDTYLDVAAGVDADASVTPEDVVLQDMEVPPEDVKLQDLDVMPEDVKLQDLEILPEDVLLGDSEISPEDIPMDLWTDTLTPDGPVAVIQCTEGDEVIPQTVLHLFGDQSTADGGTVSAWEWSVDQPLGSQSVFLPSETFPNPTFEANAAGLYTFHLTVWDDQDEPSTLPAIFTVLVIPDEAIHVELLWHTPGDPDETDTGPVAGSDLDLHFVHPSAQGLDLDGDGAPDGWFDSPFDCFWFNPHPSWASLDPTIDDDPSLDRDDTDGAGPENINLNIPEDLLYKIGVHYWNDQEFGPSEATLRVYIYSQLVLDESGVDLVNKDMWEACTVDGASGQVTLVPGPDGATHKITPDYIHPNFQ